MTAVMRHRVSRVYHVKIDQEHSSRFSLHTCFLFVKNTVLSFAAFGFCHAGRNNVSAPNALSEKVSVSHCGYCTDHRDSHNYHHSGYNKHLYWHNR